MQTQIKTKDVDEAAFFWTLDDRFSLLDVESNLSYGRIVVWFVFSTTLNSDEFSRLKSDYRFGKCLVEPRKYASKRSEIKSIIRDKCSGQSIQKNQVNNQ